MAKKNEDATFILNSKSALPNKLLQSDGTITDITGKQVVNPVDSYNAKPALPNKFLNPDGTYSTLNEIIASMVDTSIYVVVDELPAEGDPQKIYLVPDGKGGFVEYHWTGTKWDAIGTVDVDLSDYSTTQEMMNAIEASALLTLNSAKSYTDEKIAEIDANMQVFYWNGKTTSDGKAQLNDAYDANQENAILLLWKVFNITTYAQYMAYIPKGQLNKNTQYSSVYGYCYSEGENDKNTSFHRYYIQQSLTISYLNGTVSSVSSSQLHERSFLDTNTDYTVPYTPLYNGSPATKKYVDDSIATNITNMLGGSY